MTNPPKKKKTGKVKEKQDYWDEVESRASTANVYPHLGDVSLKNFLNKVVMGVFLALIPAIIFFFLSSGNFMYLWGVATMLVSGFYFLMAGFRDMSRTSAKQSYKHYQKRVEITQNREERFKFNLGILQFGNVQEDIGTAICLLVIGVFFVNLV
ncbi:MAG: hypothetical protein ACW97X_03420 [Candidatus Hodarchaeales archaeon]|jgi:hypothetical protein